MQENVELQEAIARAAGGGLDEVGPRLLEADLIVPALRDAAGEPSPAGIRRPDGDWEFVCFTHRQAVSAWDPGHDLWIGAAGDDLVDHVLASGGVRLLVNPAGPHPGAIERPALERLGARPRSLQSEPEPAIVPQPARVVEALRGGARNASGLVAVHNLAPTAQPNDIAFMLGLTVQIGAAPEAVVEQVGALLREVVPRGVAFELLPRMEGSTGFPAAAPLLYSVAAEGEARGSFDAQTDDPR